MKGRLNLLGNRYKNFTVIKDAGNNKNGESIWLCLCDCGKEKIITGHKLKAGRGPKSCGCSSYKHKLSESRLYIAWTGMKSRCYNSNFNQYKHYGERGIKVCDEWKQSFLNFYNWAMENGYSENLTIDRINNNGNYEPSNCRWATQTEQARNKRNNVYIEHNGKTQTISAWAEELGVNYHNATRRLKMGWIFEKAFSNHDYRDECTVKQPMNWKGLSQKNYRKL